MIKIFKITYKNTYLYNKDPDYLIDKWTCHSLHIKKNQDVKKYVKFDTSLTTKSNYKICIYILTFEHY